jgi:hypothetical protein
MKYHIDDMHSSMTQLEECVEKMTLKTQEMNEALRPNRQHVLRTSMIYDILNKV